MTCQQNIKKENNNNKKEKKKKETNENRSESTNPLGELKSQEDCWI